jgi:hypothetical protein
MTTDSVLAICGCCFGLALVGLAKNRCFVKVRQH